MFHEMRMHRVAPGINTSRHKHNISHGERAHLLLRERRSQRDFAPIAAGSRPGRPVPPWVWRDRDRALLEFTGSAVQHDAEAAERPAVVGD